MYVSSTHPKSSSRPTTLNKFITVELMMDKVGFDQKDVGQEVEMTKRAHQ